MIGDRNPAVIVVATADSKCTTVSSRLRDRGVAFTTSNRATMARGGGGRGHRGRESVEIPDGVDLVQADPDTPRRAVEAVISTLRGGAAEPSSVSTPANGRASRFSTAIWSSRRFRCPQRTSPKSFGKKSKTRSTRSFASATARDSSVRVSSTRSSRAGRAGRRNGDNAVSRFRRTRNGRCPGRGQHRPHDGEEIESTDHRTHGRRTPEDQRPLPGGKRYEPGDQRGTRPAGRDRCTHRRGGAGKHNSDSPTEEGEPDVDSVTPVPSARRESPRGRGVRTRPRQPRRHESALTSNTVPSVSLRS